MSATLPALVVGIARMGYRGSIPERALSSLVNQAEEHGVNAVLDWILDDSGLLSVPSGELYTRPALLAERTPSSAEVRAYDQNGAGSPASHHDRVHARIGEPKGRVHRAGE